ncbi:MAG TPA: hypothetical protein VFB19_11015 [Mycobacterium sp.]|nr:hypothetical protein [Mycobacterium sp.]
MTELDTDVPARGGRMQIPRSRGAASGFLLILLGAWGALIPFIGPYFDFAWGTNDVWVWTAPRGWLEVLPGVATAVGGLLLLASGNRATAMLGGWLTVLAGAWFVTGRSFASLLNIGDVGRPLAETAAKYAALDLAYFSGLGAVIVFLGALALGRLSVRSLRDIQYAQRPVATTAAEPTPTPVTATERAVPPVAEREAPAGQSEAPVGERDTDELGPTAAAAEEPRHRRFGGLFRRRHETTTTG